ncbi:MAG: InlB B-repeat-containing protein [Methanobrevibacter sp.]|nr:InlB B-repeat-containing protein [Methanobrevibacter sp.]
MKNSKRILTLLILFVIVAMFSILPATASVLNKAEKHTTDDNGIQIEAKYKKITSYKITFNGNGGKIGTKTKVAKNINKGSKIKKFPATPKRTGYTFKGWYTKKSGGKKISANSKPTKSVTLYAHWTKKATKTNVDSKLLGNWLYTAISYGYQDSYRYNFNSDGTFRFFKVGFSTNNYFLSVTPHYFSGSRVLDGKYKVSNGKITFTNVKFDEDNNYANYPNTVVEYQIVKQNGKEGLKIPLLNNEQGSGSDYKSITNAPIFYK